MSDTEILPPRYPVESVFKFRTQIQRGRRLVRANRVEYLIRRACNEGLEP